MTVTINGSSSSNVWSGIEIEYFPLVIFFASFLLERAIEDWSQSNEFVCVASNTLPSFLAIFYWWWARLNWFLSPYTFGFLVFVVLGVVLAAISPKAFDKMFVRFSIVVFRMCASFLPLIWMPKIDAVRFTVYVACVSEWVSECIYRRRSPAALTKPFISKRKVWLPSSLCIVHRVRWINFKIEP